MEAGPFFLGRRLRDILLRIGEGIAASSARLLTRIAPEAIMVDWLTWPAELVLSAGGIVASWFVSRDSLSFVALQMGFALLVLAAVVSLFAYLPASVGYWRSRSQINRPS